MTTTTANSLHNPFQNRFNDPVTRRHDEMQSGSYVTLLRDGNRNISNNLAPSQSSEESASRQNHDGRIVAGMCALSFGLFSLATMLLKSF